MIMKKEYLQEQLEVVKEREVLLKEMIEQEQACEKHVESIMNEIGVLRDEQSVFLLKDKNTPEEVSLGGFNLKLGLDGKKPYYTCNNENYLVNINYIKTKKTYEIAIMPKFKSADIWSHRDLFEHQWFVRKFQLIPMMK
ncbi:hypothetical protein [Bacillus sp. GZT]|uniref:hypothetical protein n=1 Tax=Bacillus sp. GZT TaxID=936600 RepID=UPI0007A041B8|nr:hypothetical protein [Bacillus sp. GZT]KYZ67932.1 hypothetical protein A3782_17660 [Bacillus sp. GZT]